MILNDYLNWKLKLKQKVEEDDGKKKTYKKRHYVTISIWLLKLKTRHCTKWKGEQKTRERKKRRRELEEEEKKLLSEWHKTPKQKYTKQRINKTTEMTTEKQEESKMDKNDGTNKTAHTHTHTYEIILKQNQNGTLN